MCSMIKLSRMSRMITCVSVKSGVSMQMKLMTTRTTMKSLIVQIKAMMIELVHKITNHNYVQSVQGSVGGGSRDGNIKSVCYRYNDCLHAPI